MIIFLREMRRNVKYFSIWSAIMLFFSIYTSSLFPSFAGQTELFKAKIPESLQGVIGLDQLNTSSILGFYGLIYTDVILFGGIFAMLLGAGILSKEESDKTVEFLLAKPVTRTSVVTSKLLSVFLYIILFNVVIAATNYFGFEAVKKQDFSMTTFYLLSIGPLLLELVFASIGMLISIFIVKAKTILPISIGVVIGAFFIDALSSITEKTKFLQYFTPFKYVNSADLINHQSIKLVYLIIIFVVVIGSVTATYILYNKKDITV